METGTRFKLTQEALEKMKILRLEGKTYSEIAQELQCSYVTVAYAIKGKKRVRRNPEQYKVWQDQYREKNRQKTRTYWNAWHKKDRTDNPDKVKKQVRKAILKMKYSITLEDYQQMCEKQNNLCAICHEPDTRDLSVDHNHITGKVRGLLCQYCNLAIGNMKEDIVRLQSAIEYLRSYHG